MQEHKYPRQTGRTTRMLAEAKRLAEAGHAVFVVECNAEQATYRTKQHIDLAAMGVSFITRNTIGLDVENKRVFGRGPNTRVLIDHYVAECEVAALQQKIAAWHDVATAFDKTP